MSDEYLYITIRSGDMRAFEMLVLEYNLPLNSFVYRLVNDKDVTEDIVQDVFASVWINRNRLDFSNPISGYLYSCARNACLNFLHKSKRYRHMDNHVLLSEDYTDALLIEEEVNRILTKAIEQLPPRMKEVISLSLEGLSQGEIAERMKVTISNVKNLKAQGLKRLKEILGHNFIFILIKMIR